MFTIIYFVEALIVHTIEILAEHRRPCGMLLDRDSLEGAKITKTPKALMTIELDSHIRLQCMNVRIVNLI